MKINFDALMYKNDNATCKMIFLPNTTKDSSLQKSV